MIKIRQFRHRARLLGFGVSFLAATSLPLVLARTGLDTFASFGVARAETHSGGGGHDAGGGHTGGRHDGARGKRPGRGGHSGGQGAARGGGRGGETAIENRVFRRGGSERASAEHSVPRGRGLEDRVYRGGRDAAGGQPRWARGGIPEVELGRLNVARAPQAVRDRALIEAYDAADLNGDGLISPDERALVHSPTQNLALYQQTLTDPAKRDLDAATVYLGKASDKNNPIEADTVVALNIILDIDADLSGYAYTPADGQPVAGVEAFAMAAEDVRRASAAAHGDEHDGGEGTGH